MDFPAYKLNEIPVNEQMTKAMGHKPSRAFIDRDLLLVYEDEKIIREMKPDFDEVLLLDGGRSRCDGSGKSSVVFGWRVVCELNELRGSGLEKDRITMEKNSFENPYSIKKKAMLDAIPEQKRREIDDFFSLPKEQRYIKPIKRKMKPDLKAGDIFAMHLSEDVYLYGKIIKKAENLPMIEDDFYIVLIGNLCTKELENPIFSIDKNNYLLGPWIISDSLWRNGKCFTVGNCPVVEDKLDIGFYKSRLAPGKDGKLHEAGFFMDIHGNKLEREPDIFELCAYITIDGIEHDIKTQIILGNLGVSE